MFSSPPPSDRHPLETRSDGRPVVVHSLFEWLPSTMTWVYSQVRFADGMRAVVFADRVSNLDSFPWRPIYSPSVRPARPAQMLRGQALVNRLGIPVHPAAYTRAIRTQSPRLLHSHFGDRGYRDMSLCSRFKLPQVVTFYGYDVSLLPTGSPRWRGRYAKLFEQADRFLCEGPHMAATLVELGCPSEKVHVQRLGVDLEAIPYRRRRAAEDGSLRVLVASTFAEKKGIPYGLEALSLLARAGYAVKVTIIGDSSGTERQEREKQRILKTLEDRSLRGRATLLGYVSHSELWRQAYMHDVFLAPSMTASDGDTEGGAPVTIIEMSASGMPVVSTRHCDIPHVVQDGVTGFLAAERDSEGLAGGIKRLADSPELRIAMGHAGRRHVEDSFDARILARKLEVHYLSLL